MVRMIKITNLVKEYDSKTVLNGIDLTLPDVGFIVIWGENGSGKSTLLNLIGGLDSATSGEITVDGLDISIMSERQLSEYREKYVSMVFQNDNLFDDMDAKDNIEIIGKNRDEDSIIESLEIKKCLFNKVKNLSGGEKRKVVLARGMQKDAPILLCDEPTSSLDTETSIKTLESLKKASQKRLVIMVTHEREKSFQLADEVISLENGKANILKSNINMNAGSKKHCKNRFGVFKFSFKNMFVNKKKMARTCVQFTFILLAILLASIVLNVNFLNAHKESIKKEREYGIVVHKIIDGENRTFTEDDVAYFKGLKVNNIIEKKTIYKRSMPLYWDVNNSDFSYTNDEDASYFKIGIPYINFAVKKDEKLTGRYPLKKDEIAITSYLADYMIEYGYRAGGNVLSYSSYEDILNTTISLNGKNVKITGIKILDFEKYGLLKEHNNREYYGLFSYDVFTYGKTIYVESSFFDYITEDSFELNREYDFLIEDHKSQIPTVINEPIELNDGSIIESLNEDEIIISKAIADLFNISNETDRDKLVVLKVQSARDGGSTNLGEFKVVGISSDGKDYFNKSAVKAYLHDKVEVTELLIEELKDDVIEKLLTDHGLYKDSKYQVATKFTNRYDAMEKTHEKIKTILIGGLVVFIILYVMSILHYIAGSINVHQKKIAILKSFGIRNTSIANIFLVEILTLNIVSFAVSLGLSYGVILLINSLLSRHYLFEIPLLQLNFIQVVISLVLVLVICFICIYLNNRKIKGVPLNLVLKEETGL